jgi:hypothetical protein
MARIAELLITLEDTGQIKVEGCLEQKLLAYGLLSVAKDVVNEYSQNLQKRVVVPSAQEVSHLRAVQNVVKP